VGSLSDHAPIVVDVAPRWRSGFLMVALRPTLL